MWYEIGDSCGQGTTYLHWNGIGCIQERGGLGLCDDFFYWRLCQKLEGFMMYLIAFMAKAIQKYRKFPANCFSYDVQPPFPVSDMWWFCTVSITLALKYQGIFVTRSVTTDYPKGITFLIISAISEHLCASPAGREGSLSSFIFTRMFLLAGVMWPLGGFLKQLQVHNDALPKQLTCCS